ncbi:hypothetical protein P3S68_023832 [Capsicum galapagoense]
MNYAHLILLFRDLRWLVCGILADPSPHTKPKGLVVSNKDIESDIMDQTKTQENESLKQEIRWLRQQMTEMHRAWASGLPPPLFPFIDPTNTSSFPPKSQSQFSTIVDTPQHDSEFILSQKHLNTSTTFPLAPQHKPATFTAPYVICDLITQSSTGTSTLARPMVGRPHAASEPIFNTLGDHCYTPEPSFKLTGPPKFLNKNAMKNSLGPAGKEDVSYKDWGMPSSSNLLSIFEMLKFEEQDGHEESVKHLGQYCNILREPGGKKNEKDGIDIVVGERVHPRRRRHRCRHHPPIPQTYQSPSRPDVQSKLNNEVRKKLRDSFTPIGESYASLFQRLVQRGMITPLLGYTLDPYSRSFDPNVRCAYHSDVQGHSIEDCRALKREIEKIIHDKLIMVQNINSEDNSSHADIQICG